MEETYENLIHLKRHLNSIEHMIYVSCKFTRTTEMLKKVMETIVLGYEQFFNVAYSTFLNNEEVEAYSVSDKIQMLSETLASRGINIDLSDYFLLKRLLISEFDCIGEYRKNLCLVSYIDDQEYVINMNKILEFYENLKFACSSLTQES